MSMFEFDAEKEWKLIREAEREAGYEEGMQQGALNQLLQLAKEQLLSIPVAAEKAGMSEEEFRSKLHEI